MGLLPEPTPSVLWSALAALCGALVLCHSLSHVARIRLTIGLCAVLVFLVTPYEFKYLAGGGVAALGLFIHDN